MKKTLLIMLTLLLVLMMMSTSLAAPSAFQDKIDGGGTVKLTADVDLTGCDYLMVTGTVTLDLNGRKIFSNTDNNPLIYVKQGANLTIVDNVGGGSIVSNAGGIVIGNYGTVTLQSGTIQTKDNPSDDAALYNYYYDYSGQGPVLYGTSTILGGTLDGPVWNCGVMSIMGGTLMHGFDNSGKMTIGGSAVVKDNIIVQDGADAPLVPGCGTFAVSGGTFDANVTPWIVNGFVAVRNANGTYTIMKPAAPVVSNDVPATGDETPIALLLCLLLMSGVILLNSKRRSA